MSLEDKTSIDNLYTNSHEFDPSKIMFQSTELNNLQPMNTSHQTSSLMTKATLTAINKVNESIDSGNANNLFI